MKCYSVGLPETLPVAASSALTLPASDDNAFDDNANGWEDLLCVMVQASSVSLKHHNFMYTLD